MYELELIASDEDVLNSDVDLRSLDEVRSFYESLLGQRSVSALRFVECGEAFAGFGLFDEASECYGKALAKDGGCLRAYLARGELYFQLAVCASSDDSRQALGRKAVEDFRRALMLSLGMSDVVWSLGMALLLVEDPGSVQSLAKNVLMKADSMTTSVRCDFLYLLGLADVFAGDREEADEALEELSKLEGGLASGWFGKIVCSLVLAQGSGVDAFLIELEQVDSELFEAGRSLQQSGCAAFVDVVRALSVFGFVTVKKRK
jgi:tetratricopeptide (TPR) repeat protein